MQKLLVLAADKSQDVNTETAVEQPDITLRKILLGRQYSLEQYKSLASKTALLDAAILSGDGNAVLIVCVSYIAEITILQHDIIAIKLRKFTNLI